MTNVRKMIQLAFKHELQILAKAKHTENVNGNVVTSRITEKLKCSGKFYANQAQNIQYESLTLVSLRNLIHLCKY